MKYAIRFIVCVVFVMGIAGCKNSKSDSYSAKDKTTNITAQSSENGEDTTETIEDKETTMKLFINDKEIPVTWETNDSVKEIENEVKKNDIVVEMSMYSDNEQVGSLGRKYTSSDKQTTTHNGDIVLYNSSNIVVFYGSNSWAYTRLGKMELSEQEVVDMLSNGNVTIKMTR